MENFTKRNAGHKILELLYDYDIKMKRNDAANAFHEPERRSGPIRALGLDKFY